jgi:hypothetical protein
MMLYLNKSNISVQVPPVLPGVKREPGANPGRSGHCKWGAAPEMPLGHEDPGRRGMRCEPRVRRPAWAKLSIAFRGKAKCSSALFY